MTSSSPTASPKRGNKQSGSVEGLQSTRIQRRDLAGTQIDWRRGACLIAIVVALATIYLLFVAHYSINVPFWDEWDDLPLIHAAVHSHLTLSALWVQHTENRVLVPNIVIVLISRYVETYNSKSIIFLSAIFFIASYLLLLVAFRTYVGRRLTPVPILTLGIVWFSLEDTENSLWAFQLAWYMVVFFLLALLVLFAQERRHRKTVLSVAILISVAASFSSLQGLILWPIGLMYLLWDRPMNRRRYFECGSWLLAAATTAAIYFRGFNFQSTGGGGSPGFALHHPIGMAKFFFAALGNVIPAMSHNLPAHEILGVGISVAVVFVTVASFRDRTKRPLPIALIGFGILFDASVTLGRLGFGVADALSVRYTMATLLVVTGLVAFVWSHSRQAVREPPRARQLALGQRVGLGLMAAFLVIQLVTSTEFGITNGRTIRHNRLLDAQTVVNLDRVPHPVGQQLVTAYVFPSFPSFQALLREAMEDHISVFAPGPYRFYRAKGPP